MRELAPTPADPRMLAILDEAGFGADVFNARQHRDCELVELYAVRIAIHIAAALGLDAGLREARSARELIAAGGFAASFERPLAWLLEWLAHAGVVVREPSGHGTGDGSRNGSRAGSRNGSRAEPRYCLAGPLPDAGLAEARAAGIASNPSYEPTYAMLDEAAAAYCKVARGGGAGERVLMSRVSLWAAYFSNDNGYYALNNRVAAAVAAERLPPAGGRVLEIGAGLGSATEALLARLASQGTSLAAYRATEPVAFFRRRGEQRLARAHPEARIELAELDLNRPWQDQGVSPQSFDLVWGVNVLHLGRRLADVLAEARRALAPGGWLVAGEGMRPTADAPVAAELPFQLLEGFVDVELDPVHRPRPGFLTARQWRAAFADAGFTEVTVAPDVDRLVEIHPTLYAAAIAGRA